MSEAQEWRERRGAAANVLMGGMQEYESWPQFAQRIVDAYNSAVSSPAGEPEPVVWEVVDAKTKAGAEWYRDKQDAESACVVLNRRSAAQYPPWETVSPRWSVRPLFAATPTGRHSGDWLKDPKVAELFREANEAEGDRTAKLLALCGAVAVSRGGRSEAPEEEIGGFTHEDLRKLREVPDWWSYFDQGRCPRCQHNGFKIPARPICTSCGWQPAFHTDEVLEAVTAIAAKISAILPPETP